MQKKETGGQPTALTSGNIRKQLVLFAIPIFLGTLLQQLYNVIDAVVAGRLVNEEALSAIGVSVPIYLLFVSIILGLAIGITILLAQFFGAKQYRQIKSLISTMSISLLVLGLVIAFGGAILTKSLLQITQTPAELLEPASAYLRMVFWGIPFSMLYNLLGAVMRSFGETKMPLYALGGVLSGVGDTLIAGVHSLASILVKLFITAMLIGKLGLLSIAIASCLGWCVASAIVVMRYKGNKWQSKAVVKMIQN